MTKPKSQKTDTSTTKPEEANGYYERNKSQFANLFGTFGANPALEQGGVIIPYELDNGTVISFKLKRAGARNHEWKRVYNEVIKPHEERVQAGKVPEAEMKALLAVVYAKTVIIGWEGIKDSAGVDVPFSVDLAIELLQFYPDLFTLIINDAHDRQNYQEAELERTEKN